MNNYLPTADFIYYVYKHTDPRTGEVIYVGHGCRGRAWIHGSGGTALRSKEHLAHLEDLTQDGYLPSDWVSILTSGLLKGEACKIEQEYIRTLQPTYNKPQGKHLLKLTPDQFSLCLKLREDGMPYHLIAEEVGVSTMTVYRAINQQTKNIGEDYAN